LDDPNGDYFTAAQVNVWLNNAQRELQKRLINMGENYYVERMLGTLVVGTDTYTLPTDFKKCHKLEIVLSGTGVNQQRRTLDPVTLIQIDQETNSGIPRLYCFKRNAIIIRPIPDQAYPIYLHQSYQVVDMTTDADIPDVPQDYDEYIAIRATLDGFMKDQRQPTDFVMDKKKEYEKMFESDAQRRDVSKPRMVVSTDDGWGAIY
jgi:hypothetical protein